MKTQDYIDIESQYGANNYKPLSVVLCEGRGAWVTDVDGKRYLTAERVSAQPGVTAHPIVQAA